MQPIICTPGVQVGSVRNCLYTMQGVVQHARSMCAAARATHYRRHAPPWAGKRREKFVVTRSQRDYCSCYRRPPHSTRRLLRAPFSIFSVIAPRSRKTDSTPNTPHTPPRGEISKNFPQADLSRQRGGYKKNEKKKRGAMCLWKDVDDDLPKNARHFLFRVCPHSFGEARLRKIRPRPGRLLS